MPVGPTLAVLECDVVIPGQELSDFNVPLCYQDQPAWPVLPPHCLIDKLQIGLFKACVVPLKQKQRR